MDLRLSSLLLVLGLILGSSAVPLEECHRLLKASPDTDLSAMHGRLTLEMGYNDNEVLAAVLKATDSYWSNLTEGPSGADEHVLHHKHKLNGTCISSAVRVTTEDGSFKMDMGNLTTLSHLLPSSKETAVLSFNYTATNFNNVLRAMNLSRLVNPEMEGVMHARALYLFAKDAPLKDSDVEQFKKQASCLGFTGEPHFIHKPEKGFCVEGEGVAIKTDV